MSRPLVSAFASAFFRRPRRNSADLTGQRARETPNCFPNERKGISSVVRFLVAFDQRENGKSMIISFPCSHAILHRKYSLENHEKNLTLRASTCASSIPPHRHGLLMRDNIIQICDCALQFPPVDRLCRFTGVFEGNAEVGTASSSGFAGFDCCCCVADLGRGDDC